MHLRIESALRYSIFIMGFTALATQVVLLRETLNIFQGNELVMGIILSNWMLLTGAGAYLGRFTGKDRFNLQIISFTQLLIAVLPVLTVAGLYLVSTWLIQPGMMFSPGQTWLITFIMLIPFCMLSGALFTLFSNSLTQLSKQKSIGKVYGIEAMGSVVGGIIFTFFMMHIVQTFQSLYILVFLNISAVLILSIINKFKWLSLLSALLAMIMISIMLFIDTDQAITRIQYPGQDIILHKETPYGKLILTESGAQKNFYDNGALYFSSKQVEKNEEIIHFAMAQHEHPNHVLLISGGISGTSLELQKYRDIKIDYLEINPAWIDIGRRYTNTLANPNLQALSIDARSHIRQTQTIYDVVIIDLPEPGTAQLNRYYTAEFFEELKNVLNPHGVVSTHLPSSANYLSPELIQSHSTLQNTLKSVFNNLIIFPGTNDYFIASDNNLTFDILGKLLDRGIENNYVNAYYYIPELLQMRSQKIIKVLNPNEVLNLDFKPRSYFIQLNYWLSHFETHLWVIIVVLVLIMMLALILSNSINKALFISGFTGASLGFILIISFQILYGYVYQMTGLIISLFMGGLALGSLFMPRILTPTMKRYHIFQLGIGALAIIIPLLIQYLSFSGSPELITIIIINLLSLATGFLIGFQFTQAAQLQESHVVKAASSSYSIDLLGSTIGSMITALILVPLLGIVETCMIIAALNIIISFSVMGKRIKV